MSVGESGVLWTKLSKQGTISCITSCGFPGFIFTIFMLHLLGEDESHFGHFFQLNKYMNWFNHSNCIMPHF